MRVNAVVINFCLAVISAASLAALVWFILCYADPVGYLVDSVIGAKAMYVRCHGLAGYYLWVVLCLLGLVHAQLLLLVIYMI